MESDLLWAWFTISFILFFPIVRILVVYRNPLPFVDSPERFYCFVMAMVIAIAFPIAILLSPLVLLYWAQYIPWERLIFTKKS
jgi:hypothetical protein